MLRRYRKTKEDSSCSSVEERATITPFFSEKIKVVSFLSIIFVLYIHTEFPADVLSDKPIAAMVQKITTGLLAPCAVPMFFAISGYLFFFGASHVGKVFIKMKKRIKTLFIPFVIAAMAYPLLPIFKELVLHHPAEKQYLLLIQQQKFTSTLKCLFFDSGTTMPWAYHLWFLRDLIIIVLFSPVLFYARRWLGYWSMAVVAAFYLLFPQLHFLYGMFWFVAGSIVLDKLGSLPQRFTFLMLAIFLAMAFWRLFVTDEVTEPFKTVEIALGVTALWRLYDMLVSKSFRLESVPVLHVACRFTFFLYLFHEPLLHAVTKGITQGLGNSEPACTTALLLSPLLLAPVLIASGFLIKKYLPCVYAMIAGGR